MASWSQEATHNDGKATFILAMCAAVFTLVAVSLVGMYEVGQHSGSFDWKRPVVCDRVIHDGNVYAENCRR